MLSWHIQRIESWMPRGLWPSAQWVKIVNPPVGDDPFPGRKKVLRFWHDDSQGQYIADGIGGGHRWIREFLAPRAEAYRNWGTVVFETANEPSVHSPEQLRCLREYSLGAMREADALGLKLCILNLAEGNPPSDPGLQGENARKSERWRLEQLAEAVEYAAKHGHYVGLHAYWLPSRGIGPLDRWHAFGRVEWNIQQWLDMGIPNALRVFIGECGVDGLIEGAAPYKGWRTQAGGMDYYRDGVATFHSACLKLKPYIEAAFLFDFGAEHPWEDYNHNEGDARKIGEKISAIEVPAQGRFGPDPSVRYWHSARSGKPISHIILHGTEGTAAAALSWFGNPNNPYKSSAHVLVRKDGTAVQIVPEQYAAHHAGYGRILGVTGNPNDVSLGLELECDPEPAPPGYAGVQLNTAARIVREWCRSYGIPIKNVLLHREVDSGRKKDPRDFNKAQFLEQICQQVHLPGTDAQTISAFQDKDFAKIVEKTRWWLEETIRKVDGVDLIRAREILESLVAMLSQIS